MSKRQYGKVRRNQTYHAQSYTKKQGHIRVAKKYAFRWEVCKI